MAPPFQMRFIVLYALANIGGTIAYMPLLTTYLPVHIGELAGFRHAVAWTGALGMAGAVAAGFSAIFFGYLSDRIGPRRLWVIGGAVLSSALLPAFAHVRSWGLMMPLLIVWQSCLNMMLTPMAAWASERVCDDRKGILGGLTSLGPLTGAIAAMSMPAYGYGSTGDGLIGVAATVIICVLPLALFAEPGQPSSSSSDASVPPVRMFRRMWAAQFAIQMAQAALFSFLFLWLKRVDASISGRDSAAAMTAALCCSVPLSVLIGKWIDRRGRPYPVLALLAILSAVGLLLMAMADGIITAIIGYIFFATASAIFMAVHGGQSLKVLPRLERLGTDLGLLNLGKIIPSLMLPLWAAVANSELGFRGLFLILALVALAGGAALFPQREG